MPSNSCALQITSITKPDSEYIKDMIINENREDMYDGSEEEGSDEEESGKKSNPEEDEGNDEESEE